MCAIFGLIDYGNFFSARKREIVTHLLAKECETRGTDASGYAFTHNGKISIYKAPIAGRYLQVSLPRDANIILGHTRMSTQGDEKLNYNNHPFPGHTPAANFALAHNGVLMNDQILRCDLALPTTKIETDSYIAVQLLEHLGSISPDSLKDMAEQLEGSYMLTLLDDKNNSYFVKGCNPICLYHFKRQGFYIYASTAEILHNVLRKIGLINSCFTEVSLQEGDILCIDSCGKQTITHFNPIIYPDSYGYLNYVDEIPYDILFEAATTKGISLDAIYSLLDWGYEPTEIYYLLEDERLLYECLQYEAQQSYIDYDPHDD